MVLENRKACNWYGVHVGSLSNKDSDGNDENVNKSKTTILHGQHTFWYIYFIAFLAPQARREISLCGVYGGR